MKNKINLIQEIRKRGRYFIFWGALVFAVVGAFFFGMYFWKFRGGLSGKDDNWAHLGSYLSGTVGICFTFINFLLLGYISWTNSTSNQKRWESDIRIPTFHKLISDLGKLNFENIVNDKDVGEILNKIGLADLNYYFFFGGEEENTLRIMQDILKDRLLQISEILKLPKSEKNTTKIRVLFKDYDQVRSHCIEFIGSKVMYRTDNVANITEKYGKLSIASAIPVIEFVKK